MRKRAGIIACILLIVMAPGFRLLAGWLQDGAPVCTVTGEQSGITIASDGAGGAYIAWVDRRGYPDIYAQRVDAMGRDYWTTDGIAVCNATNTQNGSLVINDGFGNAIIAWYDRRNNTNYDVYAQKVDPDGNMLWTANGVPVCTAINDQGGVALCPDGTGGVIIAWEDNRGSTSYDDVYIQRLDASGNPMWTADGVLVQDGTYDLDEMQVISDGKHGAIVTWVDWYSNSGDIRAQRFRADGTPLWTAGGELVCGAAGGQQEPRIISDGDGGALITWYDRRVFYDIYIQHVDSLGAMLWDANGLALCTEAEYQRSPRLAPVGDGGAIVAWYDQRNASGGDIYAQRVDGHGNLEWTVDGVPLLFEPYSEATYNIDAVPDGSGGAIVTWGDIRSGSLNIYAARIDSLGASQWTANGDSLCTAESTQRYPVATIDGAGGAIVAWQDYRALDYDVYAQRITGEGDLVATLLQHHAAVFTGRAIRIDWTLSECDPGVCFAVLRSVGGGGFEMLTSAAVRRDGPAFSFEDDDVEPGGSYRYRVDAVDGGTTRILFESSPVTVPAMPVTLYQNVPNPFNPAARIEYYLPARTRVTLAVYDAAGREIARLVDGERPRGFHAAVWDGRSKSGSAASGVYFYVLRAGKETLTRKMILLR